MVSLRDVVNYKYGMTVINFVLLDIGTRAGVGRKDSEEDEDEKKTTIGSGIFGDEEPDDGDDGKDKEKKKKRRKKGSKRCGVLQSTFCRPNM